MKSLVIVIVLVALVGLMVYTNPSNDDLSNYVRQYVIKESQKRMQDPEGLVFAPLLGRILGGIVSSKTIRTDYILFSTYEPGLCMNMSENYAVSVPTI